MGRRISLSRARPRGSLASLPARRVAGARRQAHQGPRDAARREAAARRHTERRIDSLIRRMTLEEKLDQLTLLSDGQMKRRRGRASRSAAVFSLTDPAQINHFQHDRGRAVAAAHPDPVRLRHDPRLPHDLPDPARRPARSFDPERGLQPTTRSARASRPRSASSRSTARWSTSRTSRAGAASPRPRARTRT